MFLNIFKKNKINSSKSKSYLVWGFSLTELLVTIGVLAILFGVSQLYLLGTYQKKQLDNDYNKIQFSLKEARNNALSQVDNQSWGVHFDNQSNTPFYEMFEGSGYATGTKSNRVVLGSRLQFVNPPTSSSTDIIFQKFTGVNVNNATTTIIISFKNNSSTQKTVNVYPDGSIY